MIRLPEHAVSRARARIYWTLAAVYVCLIIGLPLSVGVALFQALATIVPTFLAITVVTPLVAVCFALVPGILSLPHQKWIVPGRMPTNVGTAPYFHRRLYGLCWTSLYYNQFVYWMVLSFPALRTAVFRLFGYRGSARFTVYPDTWIRDLPLLRIGEGAYLSNKATIGTNMILNGRLIVVDEVEVGAGATIGHLACIAPGSRCEAGSEVGVAALVGMRARLEAGAREDEACVIDHGARIGERAHVRTGAHVGTASIIGAGVVVPAMCAIRGRTRAMDQAALARELAPRAHETDLANAERAERCEP
jgi:carbonic anhydrase/acetyltransferase-like protein (isoleucine patch superfamily)